MNIEELIPTRRSLLSRLKNSADDESWRTFFDTYWKLIYTTAIKAGLNDAAAQDVVQETVISVLKSMPEFHYRQNNQSFKSWLLRLTRWRIGDQFRRQAKLREEHPNSRTRKENSEETELLDEVPDPASLNLEASWEADWEQNLMEAAIDRVRKKIDPKAYQMFDLYVFKEWPVSRVAQALKVSPTRVYLAKHRVSNLIKKQVKQLRQDPLKELPLKKAIGK